MTGGSAPIPPTFTVRASTAEIRAALDHLTVTMISRAALPPGVRPVILLPLDQWRKLQNAIAIEGADLVLMTGPRRFDEFAYAGFRFRVDYEVGP